MDVIRDHINNLFGHDGAVRTAIGAFTLATAILANAGVAVWEMRAHLAAREAIRGAETVKFDIDRLESVALDASARVYVQASTVPLYQREAIVFPLEQLKRLADTLRARQGGSSDIQRLSELEELGERLAAICTAVSNQKSDKDVPAAAHDPKLEMWTVYFGSFLVELAEVRSSEDTFISETSASASHQATKAIQVLLGTSCVAILLVFAVFRRYALASKDRETAFRLLQESERKYSRFFNLHPLPAMVFDGESLRLIAVNQAAIDYYGYNSDVFLSLPLSAIFADGELERWSRAAPTIVPTEGTIFRLGVFRHVRGDGKKLSAEVHHLHLGLDDRAATLAVMVDITERSNAEVKIAEVVATLEQVLDNIPQAIAWKDESLRYLGGNKIFARDAGLSSALELRGKSDSDLAWAARAERIRTDDMGVLNSGVAKRNIEILFEDDGGRRFWRSLSKIPLSSTVGGQAGLLYSYEDVSVRKENELSLLLQSRALDASLNAILITARRQASEGIAYVNPAFERITGYSSAEVIGRDCSFLQRDDRDQPEIHQIRAALATDSEVSVLLRNYRKDGSLFWNQLYIAPVRDGEGRVTHHVSVANDVTQLVEQRDQLNFQANFDSITELPNRSCLLARCENLMSDLANKVHVLFVDLDGFKKINDSLGHARGDEVLREVSRRLREVTVSSDIVARYAGDEFVVVVSENDTAGVLEMARHILDVLSEPVLLGKHEVYVSASIGVAQFPIDGGDAEEVVKRADLAMYVAKKNGRNNVQVYKPELSFAADARFELSSQLRRAFKDGGLVLHYQPQVDMVTGDIFGVEALLRWQTAEGKFISPAEFIPIAEESGLVMSLGKWVFREACRQLLEWQRDGLSRVKMSVNLSPVQLQDSTFVETVRGVLEETGLGPSLLELEVTESTLMVDPHRSAEILAQLRALGVRVAIDDFGTGYSSLAYLKMFKVDRIKIDRSFVGDVRESTSSEPLTLAIIAIANALGVDVIAEGVETEIQRDFLVTHGCREGQGFLYAQAVPPSVIAEMFARSKKVGGLVDRNDFPLLV